ncbi:tyrosine-type recombinase/integrase [Acetobacter pasteurianus]|uniref:Phage DNA recombinase n=1 Tax=Acetobacter pasteurianus NBRC 3188 TaxID=1226663 RepID=A0A401WUX4_ACEPA|nr:tyrosine-type recombinase/integrase [Acetobacter pasteurianus]GCD53054.1 phage DNA recombinase [Acetobacter pasteurianus NBRC 3188]
MVSGDRNRSPAPEAVKAAPVSADELCIRTWLHNRGENTRRAYERDVRDLLAFAGKSLNEIVLPDLQAWFDSMGNASDATRRRKLSAVKSLLSYGAGTGVLSHDAGSAFRIARGRDTLHERILTREQVIALIDGEEEPRKRALLNVLYRMGLRISEACALRWRDLTRRQQGAVASVFGKGNKTRPVQVPAKLFKELMALRVDSGPDAPVIPGHDGCSLSKDAAHRVVKRAARRAGLSSRVSAHWLRHAHASHALDNNAPAHVVCATLGHASLATTTRYSHVREGDGSAKYLD